MEDRDGIGQCLPGEKRCLRDGECEDRGQICVKHFENGQGVCVDNPYVGLFPKDGECGDPPDGVCVDADLLEEAGVKDFVFESHRMARVLCDEMGSCATAGHMVEWKGVGMMMKTYCEKEMGGRCKEKVLGVNSPKWMKGRRIASRTKGLKFTAIAARWESQMEEIVLKMGIRMGM